MQAIFKLIQAFLWAWQYARENPRKSIAAGVGVGATSLALMGGVTGPPAAFHPGNITNIPGSNGQVFESNGDGTYTFGTDDGGVGGGATELSGLDDVSDTLVGNSGDFLGWSGTAWDDLTISLDTLSDTTITAGSTGEVLRYSGTAWVDATLDFDDLANTTITSWASGEVPRWNGSALVDSKLASTDLSDFAATIVGDTGDVIGWSGTAWDDITINADFLSDVTITSLAAGEVLRYNGSALVDATLSIDDLTEVTITTPADDQFLRYNGSGWVNETVSLSASVDATGITDGYVYTADGDATPAWEAPAVGGMLTPDGSTAITKVAEFNVTDYNASGSKKIFFCTTSTAGTTTVTTKDSGGSALAHDMVANQGVVILGAGAASSLATPVVSGVHSAVTQPSPGVAGGTTYEYTVVAFDGNGGRTTASAVIQTTTGNATLSAVNCNRIKFPIPYGATSVAIYGRGTTSGTRKLLTLLETVTPWRGDGTVTPPNNATIADAGGGVAQLTVASGHGIVANDYIHIKATSSGDTEYDAEFLVASVTATTITLGAATFSDVATVWFRRAHGEWDDKGDAVALSGDRYQVNQENPPMRWRAGMAVYRGQQIFDTTSGRCFRAAYVAGDRRTGTTEPTWSNDPLTTFADGNVRWVRDLMYAPYDEPSSAGRQALLTTVATVPTSSTFTTTDAATADISSNALCCAHNDTLAFRACEAAANAYAPGAKIKVPAGEYQLYTPKQTNTSYWSRMGGGGATYAYAIWHLSTGVADVGTPGVSVELDPQAVVRVRQMCNAPIIEDMDTGGEQLMGCHMFVIAQHDVQISGGTWEWVPFIGGLTEHETLSGASYAQKGCWLTDQVGFSGAYPGEESYRTKISDTNIHWPSTMVLGHVTGVEDSIRTRKMTFENVNIYYGGGDGDIVSHYAGDLEFIGGEVRNVHRLSSHGFYLGVTNARYKIIGTTIGETYKNAVQVRGATGDQNIRDITITNVIGDRCGPLLIGDQTTTNPVFNVSITGCTGLSIRAAYARNLSITGGQYKDVNLVADCKRVSISNITTDTMDLGGTVGSQEVKLNGATVRTDLKLRNLTDAEISNVNMLNPFIKSTALVSGVYEWIQIGATNEYYCRLRSTGGDPGFSTPSANTTVLLIRDTASVGTGTTGPGTLGSLNDESWTFADPTGSLGYSTYIVRIGDSAARDPDGNAYGTVWLGTISSAAVGLTFVDTLTNVTIKDCKIRSTWTNTSPLVNASTPTLINHVWDNVLVSMEGLPATGATFAVDMGTTAMPWCDWRIRGGKIFLGNPVDVGRGPFRFDLAKGGHVRMEDVDLTMMGNESAITNAFGQVHMKNCRVQTNEYLVALSASADTATHVYTNLAGDGTSHEMVPFAYPATSMPSVLTHGTHFVRRTSDGKLYADSGFGGGAFNIAADATVTFRVLDAARLALASNFEFMGDLNNFNAFGEMEGNLWRGSDSATYAQIASNQSDYQLIPLLNKHLLSTDASREIDGFDAPAGGLIKRRALLVNAGSFDIVLKDDTDTGSAAENRIAIHTNADLTLSAGESIWIEYDTILQRWRTIGFSTSSYELKSDILPLRRVAQWADEPQRIQLALAA